MKHASLFSGIGGFDLAAKWMGWQNAFFCEKDDWCREILKYHFPNSIAYEDITKSDFCKWRGQIDVLSGGFPCQPFSLAGKRKGTTDDRYLWPEMLRTIRQVRPHWVIGENVFGITSMVQPGNESDVEGEGVEQSPDYTETICEEPFVIETICRDLESEGYTVQTIVVPACALGAPHRRDRVWFIARHNTEGNNYFPRKAESPASGKPDRKVTSAYSGGFGCDDRFDYFREGPLFCDKYGNAEKSQSARDGRECRTGKAGETTPDTERFGSSEIHPQVQSRQPDGNITDSAGAKQYAPYTASERLERDAGKRLQRDIERFANSYMQGCWKDFPTESPVCSANDGIPAGLDSRAFPKWRINSIKGFGNAIVPQVAYLIFKAIEEIEESLSYQTY